jgi:chromosome partitioning protein
MRVVSFVTQKGGSGKSTLAASLAVAAQEAGEKVFLLDADRQGTLARWVERRETETPGFDRVASSVELEKAIDLLSRQSYSLVVVDTAGADSPTTAAAIRLADLCLVPARPTPADLEATQPTLEAIQSTRRKFAFVLSQAPTSRSARLTEAVSALRILGVMAEPPIAQRNDHQDAMGTGLGVTEYNTHGKAADEIRQLWAWVAKKMKG